VRCRVTLLRREGVRLRRDEWPEAAVGELCVRDVDAHTNSYRRHLRMAELWEVGLQSRRLLVRPLADPEILRTVDAGFLLAGVELEPKGTRIAEHRQLWLCFPVPHGR
jgi:hypothetical protein